MIRGFDFSLSRLSCTYIS
ncbi:hypothetical protein LINPERHAP2_LOCUS42400 [Linum perenne]